MHDQLQGSCANRVSEEGDRLPSSVLCIKHRMKAPPSGCRSLPRSWSRGRCALSCPSSSGSNFSQPPQLIRHLWGSQNLTSLISLRHSIFPILLQTKCAGRGNCYELRGVTKVDVDAGPRNCLSHTPKTLEMLPGPTLHRIFNQIRN